MLESKQAGDGATVQRLRAIIESEAFQRFIIGVILLNAVGLGLETSPTVVAVAGDWLTLLDRIALAIFVVEILAKLVVYRWRFFQNAWNVFDFVIVAVSLLPTSDGFAVMRALRVLRVLRLVSMVPSLRLVVQALLGAIPAMSSVIALLALIFYVCAVMATKLFGTHFDEEFGTLGRSLYTLFQIMTLESWSAGIVRPVMKVYPYAWLFFVPFILVITFAVLNLFIAIVVNSMTEAQQARAGEAGDDSEVQAPGAARGDVAVELSALRGEIAALRALMERERGGTAAGDRR